MMFRRASLPQGPLAVFALVLASSTLALLGTILLVVLK